MRAGDRRRLEHLCRSVLCPTVAQEALELTAEGRVLLRLRLVATLADPRVITRILAHLGLPLEPPGPAPPRQPSWLPDDAI